MYKIFIDGIEYPNAIKAAAALGLHSDTVYRRLGSDRWPNFTKLSTTFTIDGIDYSSAKAAATALGVSTNTIYYRCWRPNFTKLSTTFTIDGIDYSSAKAAATALGVDTSQVYYRCSRPNFPTWVNGKPKLSIRSYRRQKEVFVNGVRYDSVIAATRAHGVPRSVTYNRLASTLWPTWICDGVDKSSPQKDKKARKVSIDGVVYASITAAAAALGSSSGSIWFKINRKTYPEWKYV